MIMIYVFLFVKQNIKDKFFVFFIFLTSIIINFKGLGFFLQETSTVQAVYSSAQKIEKNNLIDIASTVLELKKYSLFEVEKYLFYFDFKGCALLLSLFGLYFFLKNNLIKIIFFIPLVIFSYLTFTKGIRFLIYTIPYIYFGFIYLFYFLYKKLLNKRKISNTFFNSILIVFFITLIWKISPASCLNKFSLNCEQKNTFDPYFDTKIVKGIIKINNFKENYNIISSLDYGYLIDYYTKSIFELNPSLALKRNKYKIFYDTSEISKKDIFEEYRDISYELGSPLKKDSDIYILLTNDFIKWWPTISKLNSKSDSKISQILEFTCKKKINLNLECKSNNGIKSKINLKDGSIDNIKLIYKKVIKSKNSYSEKILNSKGDAIIIFSPDLEYKNLYAIFPKQFENSFFIKNFFFKNKDDEIILIDDKWPVYKIFKFK